MKKNKFTYILALSLIVVSITAFLIYEKVYAAVPLDTSIEDSRDAGTDLYEATKCYNVLPLTISSSSGADTSNLHDEKYSTSTGFSAGTEITVSCDTQMNGIYIIWDSLIPSWQMKIGENTYTFGEYGYLHEYVELPEKTTSLTIIIPNGSDLGTLAGVYEGGARISDIYGFEDDNLPSYVQLWQPPLENADILIFSTHADDEDIFFGGFMPIYGAEQGLGVQIAYFTQHWDYAEGSKIREHEKLNGLWLAGAVNYPILGNFKDGWSSTYDEAASFISADAATQYLTECIRRTHPQVVISHDFAGEYGHGQHILVTNCAVDAIELANDPDYDTASVELYGTWDTPKFYIHLYEENQIELDLRSPLESFDGKRAIDVARQAYLCHESQQWCFFTVDDYGPYDNSLFGLYRTTVGPDVNGNDVMENLTSYAEQFRIAEEERLAEEARIAEEERLAEEARIAEEERLAEEAAASSNAAVDAEEKAASGSGHGFIEGLTTALFVAIALILVIRLNTRLVIRRKKVKKS